MSTKRISLVVFCLASIFFLAYLFFRSVEEVEITEGKNVMNMLADSAKASFQETGSFPSKIENIGFVYDKISNWSFYYFSRGDSFKSCAISKKKEIVIFFDSKILDQPIHGRLSDCVDIVSKQNKDFDNE